MMFTAINTKTIEYDENIYMKYLLMKKIITYKLSNKNSIISIVYKESPIKSLL